MMTARLASQAQPPPRRLGDILIGCLGEISGRLLDQICRVIDLGETMHDAIVNPGKPFGPVKFGPLVVSNDQFCELQGDDASSFQNDRFDHAAWPHGWRFLQKESLLSLWCVPLSKKAGNGGGRVGRAA
jgi:hypothetical protein